VGRSRSILLGVNLDVVRIIQIVHRNISVKFKLKNKCDNFQWILIAVYGLALKKKDNFLLELAHTCSTETLPLLVGGDFNVLRNPSKKNNTRYDDRWLFLLNVVINNVNLRELQLSGRQYTPGQITYKNPTYQKLDRILASPEWEMKYPKATVQTLTREISYQTPLLLDTGNPSKSSISQLFKFELSWLLKDGFYELVADIWRRKKRSSMYRNMAKQAKIPQ
jgi:hypothetical protein